MAMLKVLNGKGKYHDLGAREDVANYMFNSSKMLSGYRGGIAVTEDFLGSMNQIATKFDKTTGVQLRHFVLSFTPDELNDPEEVNKIACHITRFIGKDYQAVFSVHENTENLHIHFMFNAISYRDGHRYRGTKKEYYDLINFIKSALRQYYGLNLMTVSNQSDRDIQGK